MKHSKTRILVMMAFYIAMAVALDYIKEFIPFLNMPSGGSINIALIPVVLSSFQLGIRNGTMVGLCWWLVSFILGLNPYYICLLQYLLDYIVPSAIMGLSAVFYHKKKNSEAIIGIVVMMAIRTLSILLSGAYFWPGEAAAGSLAAFSGSIAYNLPYSLATAAMLVIVIPIMLRYLKKYLI